MDKSRVSSADILAGAVFVLAGTAFLVASLGYEVGTLRQMGPGYFPAALSVLLIAFGLGVAGKGLLAGQADAIGRITVRPLLMIGLALIVFAVTVDPWGLMPAVFCTAVLSALAAKDTTPLRLLSLAVGLPLACWLIFVLALQLRMPLWGW